MIMTKQILFLFFLFYGSLIQAQLKWINVDSQFQPLPGAVHVYKTTDSLDGKSNTAYYVEADLRNKKLDFTVDTTRDRRLTPELFYEKNNNALVVVNCTFFSFETNRNLNTVMKDGKLVAYNFHSIPGKGKDTFTYRHPFESAIGISKKRDADIAWLFSDSSHRHAYASQSAVKFFRDSFPTLPFETVKSMKHTYRIHPEKNDFKRSFQKWKMQTAVGGGPVLLQNGEIKIANNEELKFTGKAIDDKHPRTAMGYTKEGKLIILVVQGRSESGSGASLTQEAQILKDLGCVEALNLDGGGSSCLLVNGKETIKPSDKEGQRPVPAVFIIKNR